MKETENDLLPGTGNILRPIEIKQTKPSENIASDIQKRSEKPIENIKPGSWKDVIVQEKPLPTMSKNTELVESVGMSLIDESANYMFGLLQESSGPKKVEDACNCAKQIQSLLRLKLDVIKLAKELKK